MVLEPMPSPFREIAKLAAQLGGWKTEKMMRRYAPVTDQTLRRAAEALSCGHSTAPTLQERGTGKACS